MAKECSTCQKKDAPFLMTSAHVSGLVCKSCFAAIEEAAKKTSAGETVELVLNDKKELVEIKKVKPARKAPKKKEPKKRKSNV